MNQTVTAKPNQITDHKVEYLPSLTALRGIAALLVAVFHFEMAAARFVPAAQSMFFEKCYLMVDLFFIMSGFIMMHVYSNHFKNNIQASTLKNFLVARFARVYPLHLFSLLLLVVIVRWLTDWGNPPILLEQPSDILPNIFLLHSFGFTKIYSWNIPSWSISAEWAAYLLFPVIALCINKKKTISVILLIILVVVAYYSIMYVLPRKNPINPLIPVPHNLNTTFDYGYIRGIAGFTAGVLVYLIYELRDFRKAFSSDMVSLLVIIGIILSLHFSLNDGITVSLFAILVLSITVNTGRIASFCNRKFMQFLGNISYSVYLMQIFLQEPFSHGMYLPGTIGVGRGKQNIEFFSGAMYCMIYLILLVLLSYITYQWVERPCRKFINRIWGN
ncbi:acyltransferase family protein [Pedobacter caeni]|uniref:Peptidoglycan/LPS O-acetylase OafA/YrhL, contains acyltransferase and SGNH-hydrolase domains n=1 Tax=Pedobacter caeni TaxID=288992 RepID=A0A1M4UG16_9SPHI|nr:acyltransferase [Pedobacter caeni]SHE55533.1 Peptidoglycan/LPS O-acetylase OafA/YrhL, contains acyltransferase and SGNH-hydrolase domains [Pedobacter caeni]